MKKIAVITGIRGQTARVLAQLLVAKEYDVVGTYRHCTVNPQDKLEEAGLDGKIAVECLDITDSGNVNNLMAKYKPNEFYSLAAQSDEPRVESPTLW